MANQIDISILRTLSEDKSLTKYLVRSGFRYDRRKYWFKDNGGLVLAIAHADSVSKVTGVSNVVKAPDGKEYIIFPRADNRIGIYIITHLLPQMGVKADVLITTDEEIGASTGAAFVPSRQYNWMVQFDRRGRDVVTYRYIREKVSYVYSPGFHLPHIYSYPPYQQILRGRGTPRVSMELKKEWDPRDGEFRKSIVDIFGSFGSGSSSDISKMEHLGIKGFNVGVGYYNEHSDLALLCIDDLRYNLGRFLKYYKKYCGVRFTHEPDSTPWKGGLAGEESLPF